MDQAAVPAVFNYQPIPAAVGGYYSQAKQPPSNGTTFTPGNWIQIPIVTGRIGQFYDPQRCYFMFQVIMNGPNQLMLERVGAHAFIESLELWLNGQPLEQIQQYNNLMQLIRDQYYGLGRADVCAEVEGCASEFMPQVSSPPTGSCAIVTRDSASSTFAAETNTAVPGVVRAANPGSAGTAVITAVVTTGSFAPARFCNNAVIPALAQATPAGGPTPAAATNGRWFAIPILSGLLGTLASKAFPALVFAPGSLFWQIKLAQPAAPGVKILLSDRTTVAPVVKDGFTFQTATADANTWEIRNFNFVSGAVTLQSGVAATILSAAASGQLDLNTKSFTNVFASVAAASSANIIIPLRKLSLNSVFVTFRDPNRELGAGAGASAYGGFLGRIAPSGCLNDSFTAQWRFGNELIREYPYQVNAEHYVEVLRNLHEWHDKELNFCLALTPLRLPWPVVSGTYVTGGGATEMNFNPIGGFYAAYATAAAAFSCDKASQLLQNCGFFMALDLDVFSGSSSTSRSGRNTTGDQITLNLSCPANMFDRTMRADIYGFHDLRVNIQSGGIAVPVS